MDCSAVKNTHLYKKPQPECWAPCRRGVAPLSVSPHLEMDTKSHLAFLNRCEENRRPRMKIECPDLTWIDLCSHFYELPTWAPRVPIPLHFRSCKGYFFKASNPPLLYIFITCMHKLCACIHVYICVSACVGMHEHVYGGQHMYVEARSFPGEIIWTLFTLFFEAGFQLNSELINPASQFSPGILWPCLPHPIFKWVLRIQIPILKIVGQVLYIHQVMSPDPLSSIFTQGWF